LCAAATFVINDKRVNMLNRDILVLFFVTWVKVNCSYKYLLLNVTIICQTHCIICGKEVSDMAKRDSLHSLITDVIVICNRTLLFTNRNRWEEFTVYF